MLCFIILSILWFDIREAASVTRDGFRCPSLALAVCFCILFLCLGMPITLHHCMLFWMKLQCSNITITFYKESYWSVCMFIFVSRHSDVNLAVMDNSSVKGEDQTLLLEEGGQAVAAKPAYTSFTSQMFRLSLNYNFSKDLKLIFNRCIEILVLKRHWVSDKKKCWVRQNFLHGPDASSGESFNTEGNVSYSCSFSHPCFHGCTILLTELQWFFQIWVWRISTVFLHLWSYRLARRVC